MVKVNINLRDINSIKRAEKRKRFLENQGYTLIETITGFNNATLLYKEV